MVKIKPEDGGKMKYRLLKSQEPEVRSQRSEVRSPKMED